MDKKLGGEAAGGGGGGRTEGMKNNLKQRKGMYGKSTCKQLSN